MATKRKSPRILVFAVTLASAFVIASTAISATPEPIAIQPEMEATTTHTLESKSPPASDQKNSAKQEKKKGLITGMLLGEFAVITGQQGATR